MALTNQVLMPGADYQGICDQTRRLTGETATLTSGEVVTKLSGVTVGGGGASVQTSKAVSVSVNGTETITPDDGYDAMAEVVLTVTVPSGGGGEQPQLLAPTISVTEDLLTITPNPANGGFVSGWRGYAAVGDGDFALFGTLPADTLTLDLTQQGLPAAAYRFKATAIGDNFIESNASNIVVYTNVFYAVTKTLSNCSIDYAGETVRAGAFVATLTPSAGYTMSGATVTVTMGGEDITATAYSNGAISIAQVTGDVVITAAAVEELNVDFATAPWATIQYAVLNRGVAATFGDQVGAERTITLKDGNTLKLRIANATDNLYEKANGGSTGLVIEACDLYPEKYQMNTTATSEGGWKESYMRKTVMPLVLNNLPDDLAAVIATVKLKGCNSGADATVNTTEDKLFIPATHEVSSSRDWWENAGQEAEWAVTIQWAIYGMTGALQKRIKKIANTAAYWFLRTPLRETFCGVYDNGGFANNTGGVQRANFASGVALAFCI